MTPPTAPTQGAAQDLTDGKIEALRLHIVNEDCVCDYEQDVLRLLTEVKRRRALDVAATQARMEQSTLAPHAPAAPTTEPERKP